MRSLRAVVCAVVLALLAGVLVVDPAVAKAVVRRAESDFGQMVKSDPYVPKFDAKKAAKERAARVKKSDRDLAAGPKSMWSARKAKRMGVDVPLSEIEVIDSRPSAQVDDILATNIREYVVDIPGHTTWGVQWDSPLNGGCVVKIYRADDLTNSIAGGGEIAEDCHSYYFTEDDGEGIEPGVQYIAQVALYSGMIPGPWVWADKSWAARGNVGSSPLASFFGRCDCSSSTGSYLRGPVMTGNPINTATGSLTEVIQDAKVAAPGIALDVTRTYNSADTRGGLLGRGWTFPYEASLKVSTDKVIYRAEDGQRVEYIKNTDGTFKTPVGVTSKLTAVSGGYSLTMKSFTTLGFDSSGRLSSWKDGSGQGLTFAYDTNGLSKITDAAGRETVVEVVGGKVRKVTLPDGRYVGYGYVNGLLTSVRDLRGKLWAYEYDSGRLAKMVDPTGVATIQNTYNATTGRIATQIEPGNTTPAKYAWDEAKGEATWTDSRGGIWTYTYSGGLLVEEIDPRGYITIYRYNAL